MTDLAAIDRDLGRLDIAVRSAWLEYAESRMKRRNRIRLAQRIDQLQARLAEVHAAMHERLASSPEFQIVARLAKVEERIRNSMTASRPRTKGKRR